ncbi:hypothetical protein [Burkholderia gladioli]|uniref:hypothetical protein n=1 Tax=Burkholderia gladioli TaxID=28095 RepID=UPI00163E73FD|nr:hypothetical protein [Burkholderia gladioli]
MKYARLIASAIIGFMVIGATNFGHAASATEQLLGSNVSRANSTIDSSVKIVCDSTGRDDSTACLQQKLRELSGGGRLQISGKYLISRDLIIPPGVSVEGDCAAPGTSGSNSNLKYLHSNCGVLNLDASASVLLSAGSSIRAIQVLRAGMEFPVNDSTAYSGTAIRIIGDDATIDRITVLGFDRALYDDGFQRPSIHALYGDNNNGIELTHVYDVARISNCHMWPFATVASRGDISKNQRNGVAYNLHDTVDGPVLVGNFSYGYRTGFRFSNVSTVSAVSNLADNTGKYLKSEGWHFDGNLNGFSGVGNAAWSQDTGALVDLNDGQVVNLIDMHFNHNSMHINVKGGNVRIFDSEFFYSKKLMSISNSNSIVSFDRNVIADSEVGVSSAMETSNVIIGAGNIDLTPKKNASLFSGELKLPQLLLRESTSLPSYGEVFSMAGEGNLRHLHGGWAGRKVMLLFRDASVVYSDSDHDALFVSGGGNFRAQTGSVLELIYDGDRWFQAAVVAANHPVSVELKTVATLPTCNQNTVGIEQMVTDARAPIYAQPLEGGGTVAVQAICNGSDWTAH